MHYVSVMKIRKIHELQLTNVQTLVIQVHLGPKLHKHYIGIIIIIASIRKVESKNELVIS